MVQHHRSTRFDGPEIRDPRALEAREKPTAEPGIESSNATINAEKSKKKA
jgi:hypothetical protein